jgi:hypothetical protein
MMFLTTKDSPKGSDGEIMTRKKHSATKENWKEEIRKPLRQDTDLLKALVTARMEGKGAALHAGRGHGQMGKATRSWRGS